MNFSKIITSLLKPLNPIDVSLENRLPRKPFNFFERIYIVFVSIKKKNFKLSILYTLNLIKAIIINLMIIIYTPIILFCIILKIKFIRINYWQYGTIFQHSFMFLMDLENKKLNPNKYYLYIPKKFCSNKEVINILKKRLNIIDNWVIGLLLFPLLHFKKTSVDILNYDEHAIQSNSFKIFNKFNKTQNKIEFFSEEQNKILNQMFYENFSFNSNDDYVTFQIRSSDFYNDKNYLDRNSSLENYLDSINYLIKSGYKIIMFNSYSKLSYLISDDIKKNLFNYENLKKPYFNDSLELFIRKNSNFFICCNFGPKNVAQMMGVPCLITNCYPYHALFGYGELDISIPKIIYKNNLKISINEIMNSNFFLQKNISEDDDIYLKENSKDDILNATKEMVTQVTKKKQNYDDQFLRKNFKLFYPFLDGRGQISKNFLDENKDLFF